MRNTLFTVFFLLLAVVSGMRAQTQAGVIAGTVRDESKKAVPHAAITIMNLESRAIKTAISGPDGSYLVGNLRPGKYMIGAEAPGFSATAIALTVLADKAATADLALALSPNLDTPVVEAATTAPAKPVEQAKLAAPATATPVAAATPVTASTPTAPPITPKTSAATITPVAATAVATTAPAAASASSTSAASTNASASSLSTMTRRDSFWRDLLVGKKKTDNSEPVLTASIDTPTTIPDKPRTVLARADFPAGPDQAPPATGSPAAPPAPAAPATPPVDLATPFAYADFTWMNAVSRNHDSVLDGKYFSGEFRVDTNYMYDYNHPIDHTLDGTTEGTRTGEVVLQELNIGGDFHWDHMQGRILFQMGNDATAVPRNDASPNVGQWDLADAYRYISEGYAGYHMDVQHGLNIQAGIFMSYHRTVQLLQLR